MEISDLLAKLDDVGLKYRMSDGGPRPPVITIEERYTLTQRIGGQCTYFVWTLTDLTSERETRNPWRRCSAWLAVLKMSLHAEPT
jgi:hypothetical protein